MARRVPLESFSVMEAHLHIETSMDGKTLPLPSSSSPFPPSSSLLPPLSACPPSSLLSKIKSAVINLLLII